MYISNVTKTVNSIASPALVYNLKAGDPVENIDNETLLELLKNNLVKKVSEFIPAVESK
jgi:hypothetical protein